MRDSLAFLDKFQPGTRARVLERVPKPSREVIDTTPASSWISIEHDHWTVDAMIEILGRERAIQCWSASLSDLVDRPLLRNFVSGMMNVLGRSPVNVVRLFARGWHLAYRDMCEPQLIVAKDGQPRLRFENISPAVKRYPNYLHSWHGICRGFAQLAQVRGSVSFEVASDQTWAEVRFFWVERDA